MNEIELLQQIGLNKYEAEAYYTLIAEGALTGYELGKRSQVPLSRSYEILERLTQKGLALLQPGEPPRYQAEQPERFLKQVRSTMTTTLDTLENSLSALAHQEASGEFWVIRGRQPILTRVRIMLAEVRTTISLSTSTDVIAALADPLAATRARGCAVHVVENNEKTDKQELLLLIVDMRETLAGTLAAGERGQAVISTNPALVTVLNSYFAHQPLVELPSPTVIASTPPNQLDWLAWEDRKLQELRNLPTNNRVA